MSVLRLFGRGSRSDSRGFGEWESDDDEVGILPFVPLSGSYNDDDVSLLLNTRHVRQLSWLERLVNLSMA